jgi:pimeloyl-ACP methyl ester carboxylesterase
MPYAKREGLSLYYEQAGSGDPPMVFVHGWCCDHTFFQPQFEHFQASHSVTTYDLRGCGSSSQPADGYDIPTLADDLLWFCQSAGISAPVIVGHSLGGTIAVELAARHPDALAGIVAVEPGAFVPTAETLSWFKTMATKVESPEGAASRQDAVQNMFLPTDGPGLSRKTVATMCAVPPHIAAAVIHGFIAWNGHEALIRCKAPLLVLLASTGGDNDPARLLAIKPDIHIGVTVGTGHFNQLVAPEQVTPMIERFMQVAIAA